MSEFPPYFVLAATKALYARFLRWLMGSDINHAMIVYQDDRWGGYWAVEVDDHGVRLVPLDRIKGKYSRLDFYRCSKGDFGDAFRAMKDKVGAKYDWKALLVNIGRLLVLKMFGATFSNPMHSLSKYMCSEFVAEYLQEANVSGAGEKLAPSLTSPEHLRLFFENHRDIEWVPEMNRSGE